MDINKRVLLLAILQKEEDENLNDIVIKLEQTGIFSLKQGKKLLKELKQDSYIVDNSLSLKGVAKAREIKDEFTI